MTGIEPKVVKMSPIPLEEDNSWALNLKWGDAYSYSWSPYLGIGATYFRDTYSKTQIAEAGLKYGYGTEERPLYGAYVNFFSTFEGKYERPLPFATYPCGLSAGLGVDLSQGERGFWSTWAKLGPGISMPSFDGTYILLEAYVIGALTSYKDRSDVEKDLGLGAGLTFGLKF